MKSTQHSTRHVATIFSFLWTGERREGFIPKGVPPSPFSLSLSYVLSVFSILHCAQLRVNPWGLSSSLLSTPSSSSFSLPVWVSQSCWQHPLRSLSPGEPA